MPFGDREDPVSSVLRTSIGHDEQIAGVLVPFDVLFRIRHDRCEWDSIVVFRFKFVKCVPMTAWNEPRTGSDVGSVPYLTEEGSDELLTKLDEIEVFALVLHESLQIG